VGTFRYGDFSAKDISLLSRAYFLLKGFQVFGYVADGHELVDVVVISGMPQKN
jgi:hypothetical protein